MKTNLSIRKNKNHQNSLVFYLLFLTSLCVTTSCTKEDFVIKNSSSRAKSIDLTIPHLETTEYVNFANQSHFLLKGTCPTGVEKVRIEANPQTNNSVTAICNSGALSETFDFSTFSDGPIYITLTPYNSKTNELNTNKSNSASLNKDTIAPSLPLNSALLLQDLKNGYSTSISDSPLLIWNAAEDSGSGVDHYEVKIISQDNKVFVSDITSWSTQVSGSKVSGLNLSRGIDYSYKLKVFDVAGNESAEVQSSSQWQVDVTGPSLTSFDDGSDSFYTDQSPVFTIQGANDVESGIDSYSIDLGTTAGANDQGHYAVAVASMTTTGTTSQFKITGLSLTAGIRYYATLKITDRAGNETSIPGDGWLVNKELYITDGPVAAIAKKGDRLYIGGDFTHVGPWTGGGITLNPTTGDIQWPASTTTKPRVSGVVYSAISDGDRGYYIGGLFSHVGGLPRQNIAHILANGMVDPNFAFAINNKVNALALNGNTLYLGGSFTKIGTIPRNRLASITLASKSLSGWDHNLNGPVNTLALNGTTLYVGGSFTNIEGTTKNRLAAFDLPSETLDSSWSPSINNTVNTLLIDGSTLYVGGTFTGPNNYLTVYDLTSHNTVASPSVSNPVYALALNGSNLYIGGSNSLSKVDMTTPQTINPISTSSSINALAIIGSTLYAGGSSNSLTAYDITNTTPSLNSSFTPNLGGIGGSSINALVASGSGLYVGGGFSSQGMTAKSFLAALDMSTGQLDSDFNPNPNAFITHLVATDNKLFVAGNFNTIQTQSTIKFAAIDFQNGNRQNVSSLDLDPSGLIHALQLSEDKQKVFIGVSNTTKIGSLSSLTLGHGYISAINTSDYSTAFNINLGTMSSPKIALAESGGNLFAGVFNTSNLTVSSYSVHQSGNLNTNFGVLGTLQYPVASNFGDLVIPKNSNNLYVAACFSSTSNCGINILSQSNGGTIQQIRPQFQTLTSLSKIAVIGNRILWTGSLNINNPDLGGTQTVPALITDGSTTPANPNPPMTQIISQSNGGGLASPTLLQTDSAVYLGGFFLGLGGGGSNLVPIDLSTGKWLPLN